MPTGDPGPGSPRDYCDPAFTYVNHIDPDNPDMNVTCADKIPGMLTNDPYINAVHRAKWKPTAESLMDLYCWGDPLAIGDEIISATMAPEVLQDMMEAFDGDTYELHGMTPPGGATLHDFYGVNLATGQVEVSLPTGIRLTGINGDDLELKVNLRSGVQRNGILGQFASLNMEDRLVINKLIPLTQTELTECNTAQSEMWQIRDLVNSTPTLTRLRGGNPEIWFNVGPPQDSVPLGSLTMQSAPFFAGMPATKWAILHQNSSLCQWMHVDGTPAEGPEEFLWKSGQAGMPPRTSGNPVFFGAADPYLTDLIDNPPDVYNRFVASWGTQEILAWNCDNVVIMDADGTKTVYSGFFKQKDTRFCLTAAQLPHGGQQGTLPPGVEIPEEDPRAMAHVQLAARCIYKETRDGLRTYYLYNRFGQLVGFRDQAGREIGFNPGRIFEISDEFGRSCLFTYGNVGEPDQDCLTMITLPDVETGVDGQGTLHRVIQVKITKQLEASRPGQLSTQEPDAVAERIWLEKLEIGTPLDASDDYSFAAEFERVNVNDEPYTGVRVKHVRVSSDRMPVWLSTETAGGTTNYLYPSVDLSACGADYTVEETRPDTKVVKHTFDAIGNLVSVEEPAQLALNESEQAVTTTIESDHDSGADELNLKTKMTYPGLTGEAWEYQFQTDGGLLSYFKYVVGAESHQQFYAKQNVLKEHQLGDDQTTDLVTEYTYGDYRRQKSKKPPLPYGTDGSGMEFEHTF
ncbi:MAG: hypothetical protein V2A71_00960, partial [Candidatus Eisenbacteria bacterium]